MATKSVLDFSAVTSALSGDILYLIRGTGSGRDKKVTLDSILTDCPIPMSLNVASGTVLNLKSAGVSKWSCSVAGAVVQAGTLTLSALTASRAMVTGAGGLVSASTVTATELAYVSGTTSNVQAQLNDKLSKTVTTAQGMAARLDISVSNSDTLTLRRTTTTGTNMCLASCLHYSVTTQDMSDGFGVSESYYIKDSAGVDNMIGQAKWSRDGADNSGKFCIQLASAGTLADRFTVDKVGTARAVAFDMIGGTDNTALSGNVQTQINGKAPTSHASSGTTYGVASSTNYGHVQLEDAATDGSQKAITSNAVYDGLALKRSLDTNETTWSQYFNSTASEQWLNSGHFTISDTSDAAGVVVWEVEVFYGGGGDASVMYNAVVTGAMRYYSGAVTKKCNVLGNCPTDALRWQYDVGGGLAYMTLLTKVPAYAGLRWRRVHGVNAFGYASGGTTTTSSGSATSLVSSAPTPAVTSNSQEVATTAFVQSGFLHKPVGTPVSRVPTTPINNTEYYADLTSLIAVDTIDTSAAIGTVFYARANITTSGGYGIQYADTSSVMRTLTLATHDGTFEYAAPAMFIRHGAGWIAVGGVR